MPSVTDVFTPNSLPTFTYVERSGDSLDSQLARALKIKNAPISISGPSKSGKTVLLRRIVDPNYLIYVSGASIRRAEDLWRIVLAWMGAPSDEKKSEKISGTVSASGNIQAKASVVFAKAGASAGVGASGTYSTQENTSIAHDNLIAVEREIADSDFIVFVDDFHYIDKELQPAIAREIKAASEKNIRICAASVPHRADDVVRSNPELRGRLQSIDTKHWEDHELRSIAIKGFGALNVVLANNIIDRLARESFGSPQLMQAICLHLCFKKNIDHELSSPTQIGVSEAELRDALEYASTGASFQSMLESLHSGPRQRGTERKVFEFTDGSAGDVYRAILLAIQAEPAELSLTYDDMQTRVRSICMTESPVGSSITRSLEQMDEIAASYEPKAIEWMDDILDIVDPYFLFYIRASQKLSQLARRD